MNYSIKQFPDKRFTDKMDLTRFIKSKRDEIFAMKMMEYKTKSEPVLDNTYFDKAFLPIIESITSDFIEVKTVINTTNIIDSHRDLHLPKIWNKTVADNPFSHHLKQHENQFESVISKKAKSYNENMNFMDLGLRKNFATVANINQFILERAKMPFMFDAYKNGDVEQHSVGMMYVALDVAFYDEDSEKEMAFFEQAKAQAVNPEAADEFGYVWLVSEAKKREGSAVVFGSNSVTPTLWVRNYEPSKGTQYKDEPSEDTQKEQLKKVQLIF